VISHLLFVYGTLKEGFPNFETNGGRKMSGRFQTVEKFPLYLIGQRNSPCLINDPGKGQVVRGEVFTVSADALKDLNAVERTLEPDGYRRTIIQVTDRDFGHTLEVYVYMKDPEQLATGSLAAGPMAEYTLAHAAIYQKRTN
jgi:gamma-glutamylaminecyclotransferase